MQDMDLVLEEEFLELMVHLLRSLPMQDIWQVGVDSHHHAADHGDQEADILRNLQVLTLTGRREGRVKSQNADNGVAVRIAATVINSPQKM